MQNNGEFRLLNLQPKITISHYDLQAIKHIVDIAPQEAQWFMTCKKHTFSNQVYYEIEGMYIPEQITSATQVESDPMAMVSLYKEIKENYTQEETNKIMSSLTVWCHSHHNMGVSPSGQDIKQFTKQAKDALDANITLPQIMLIFNKKDTFYSKIFDPETGLIFENVPIQVKGYDFTHIDSQAKEKFKKPKIKTFTHKNKYSSKSYNTKSFVDWKWEDDDNFHEYTKDSFFEYNVLNKTFLTESPFAKILNNYKPKTANKKFYKDLENVLNPVYLAVLAEAICLDSEIIYEMGSDLKWLPNDKKFYKNDLEDFLADLRSIDLTKDQLKSCFIFSEKVHRKLLESPENCDLDSILNEFAKVISETEEYNDKLGW